MEIKYQHDGYNILNSVAYHQFLSRYVSQESKLHWPGIGKIINDIPTTCIQASSHGSPTGSHEQLKAAPGRSGTAQLYHQLTLHNDQVEVQCISRLSFPNCPCSKHIAVENNQKQTSIVYICSFRCNQGRTF